MHDATLYLSRQMIEEIGVPMDLIISVVEQSLIEKANGRAQMPAKHWMEPRPTRWFGGMSSLLPSTGYAAMKWQSGSTENAPRGLPYLTGALFLNRLDNGLVCAIMDSTWITQQRTAAESAVAVKYLAKPGATNFAILGAGVQARSHLEALKVVLPKLNEVVIYDIDPAAAKRFSEYAKKAGFKSLIVDSAREAVDLTDILVTAGPIEPNLKRTIEPHWLHKGLLGITLDYDCYWTPESFNSVDKLITDDYAQIEHIKEYGYFVGCKTPDIELGSIAAGHAPGRTHDDEIIITMNMGVSVEDVAVAKEIYEEAEKQKIGITLPL